MWKIGRPNKEDKDKKVIYGISIDQHLFDKMKNEGVSVSKFIQKLVKEYYDGKVVWVNGTFDVMHMGHIKLLEFAKSLGDVLVVGIDRDHRVTELKGSPRPINNCQYRIDFLKSIKYVDLVVTFGTDNELIEHIKSFKPAVMVVGSDYLDKRVIGSEWVEEVKYFDRFEDLSTSKILKTHG